MFFIYLNTKYCLLDFKLFLKQLNECSILTDVNGTYLKLAISKVDNLTFWKLIKPEFIEIT